MAAIRTILSAGDIIRALLMESAEVAAAGVTKVFPVVIASEARLPYIVYTRQSLERVPVKGGGADTAQVDIDIYGASYQEALNIAEAVYAALDGARAVTGDGRTLRSCVLTDASETFRDDAYVQTLTFTLRI